MRKVIVFREPVTRQYRASRLSFARLFTVLSNVCAAVVPFYFWTNTGGLWLTESRYRERPEVRFRYKFLVVLDATSRTTGARKEILVSSPEPVVHARRPDGYRAAKVQFREDEGRHAFHFDAVVPLAADEEVRGMQAALFFDVALRARAQLDTDALVHASFASSGLGRPVHGYDTTGSLVLRQARPFRQRRGAAAAARDPEDETPLLDADDSAPADASLARMLKRYRERSIAVDYVERYPIQARARAADALAEDAFRLRIQVDVPEQEIACVPTLLEVLKDAWVKYLSVAVFCWMLLERIKSFAFHSVFRYSLCDQEVRRR